MAITYEPIATTTLGSAAASYTFSSIPSTYTDLVLVFNGTANAAGNLALQFNSDTATNYSTTILYGDGSTAGSGRVTSQTNANIAGTNTSNNTATISIMNYSNSTTYKTALGRGMRSGDQVVAKVALWRSTAAITTVTVLPIDGASTWSTGSTFTLYGIKAA